MDGMDWRGLAWMAWIGVDWHGWHGLAWIGMDSNKQKRISLIKIMC
jgi:hypothetical protein